MSSNLYLYEASGELHNYSSIILSSLWYGGAEKLSIVFTYIVTLISLRHDDL